MNGLHDEPMTGVDLRDPHRDKLKVARELASLGGWAVLALFFMGQMAGWIPSVYADRLQQHVEQTQRLEDSLMEHRHRQEDLINRLGTALRVMCENQALMPWQRNNCANIPK